MKPWPKHPKIYEINTWVWLRELSLKHNKSVTLSTVPLEEWDYLSSFGFDAIWFMGVWERSPKGTQVTLGNEGLMADFRRALPDLRPEDIVGSAYCVRRYTVDEHLGGPEGLATARRALHERGLRVLLDFVPNHVAPDHPWALEHPGYFIHGTDEDLRKKPASFFKVDGNVYACGRDPYFPAWSDVLQLNAFDRGLRKAAIETVLSIASQCDGARCDMAMLMLKAVFERTWGARAGKKPDEDYWMTIIPAIKKRHQEFKFIAEAYWDLEWELQQQGFDYCYDKRLYDRMEQSNAESIRQHLLADLSYQERLVRFIENHDEPRAAATFSGGKARAAAVAVLTLAGAKLLHEGQAQGFKVRLPVFLGRRPVEHVDQDLLAFYQDLLKVIDNEAFRNGQWLLCERRGWPDNQSFLNIIAWCWANDDERYFIVVNFRDGTSQARVQVPWDELRGRMWHLVDVLSGDTYDRNGDDLRDNGLHVDLGPWQYHFFRLKHL